LTFETGEDIGLRIVEQGADLVERQPHRPVHQHQMQTFDIGVGVSAVSGRGAHTGHHQTDVVVVMQRADRDTGQRGDRTDRARCFVVHATDYRP
jgi:hypothetical protein